MNTRFLYAYPSIYTVE